MWLSPLINICSVFHSILHNQLSVPSPACHIDMALQVQVCGLLLMQQLACRRIRCSSCCRQQCTALLRTHRGSTAYSSCARSRRVYSSLQVPQTMWLFSATGASCISLCCTVVQSPLVLLLPAVIVHVLRSMFPTVSPCMLLRDLQHKACSLLPANALCTSSSS